MSSSKAKEGEKKEPKNAFDLMMQKDKSVLRYKGFRALKANHTFNFGPGPSNSLFEVLVTEEIDGNTEYDEFYERYYHVLFGNLHKDKFKTFWEMCQWIIPVKRHNFAWPYISEEPAAFAHGVYMSYIHRKPKDLKQFVKQRGLQDPFPSGVTLSYYYIRALEKADEDFRFRFLDLPVEMRLNVYRNLLLFTSEADSDPFPEIYDEDDDEYWKKFCYPAILQTCREVNNEARSVLYDENTVTCNFEFNDPDDEGPYRIAKVHNEVVRGGCPHACFIRIPEGLDDYPEFLTRVSRLEINIQSDMYAGLDSYREKVSYHPLNQYLYTLASFLMDNHRLKSVKINVDLEDMEDRGYGLILWPLRRLRNIKKVKITGVPAKYKTNIIRDLTSAEPAFNSMKHWKNLKEEAIGQLELLNEVYGECCDCGDCPLPPQVEEIEHRLHDLEFARAECCLSGRDEERMIALLANLRTTLKQMSVDRIEELVKSIKQQRAVYTDYEAVTDDGRLAEAVKIWNGKVNDEKERKGKDDEDWDDDEDVDIIETMEVDETPGHRAPKTHLNIDSSDSFLTDSSDFQPENP